MAKTGAQAKPARRRGLLRRCGVLAAIGLIATAAAAWFVRPHLGPAFLAADLPRVADAELEPRLRDIAAYGRPGFMVLVQSLGSERRALRDAAYRLLCEKVDRSIQSTHDSANWLDWLASALAQETPNYHRDSLDLAATLAERLVLLPASDEAHTTARRLRHCHVVLSACTQERLQNRSNPVAKHAMVAESQVADARLPELDSFVEILPPLAGGGLAIVPNGGAPSRLSDQLMADAKPLGSAALKPTNSAPQLNSAATSEPPIGDATIDVEIPAMLASTGSLPPQSVLSAHREASVGLPSLARSMAKGVVRPDTLTRLLELDERRRSNDATHVEAAAEAMRRLGIGEAQLQLALGAVDPDPKVRKKLVEALPLLGSVDSRAWLVWLSHDPDVEVRRAALSLLATSGDPELKKRVREAADRDSDPRVREQARAALKLDESR